MAEPEKDKGKEAIEKLAEKGIPSDKAIAYLLVTTFDMHCKVVGSDVAAELYHEIVGVWPPDHEPEKGENE